jgi:hypothetical protein
MFFFSRSALVPLIFVGAMESISNQIGGWQKKSTASSFGQEKKTLCARLCIACCPVAPFWDSEEGGSNLQSLDCAAMVKASCAGYAGDVLGEKTRR